jgi:hypothetical protein
MYREKCDKFEWAEQVVNGRERDLERERERDLERYKPWEASLSFASQGLTQQHAKGTRRL